MKESEKFKGYSINRAIALGLSKFDLVVYDTLLTILSNCSYEEELHGYLVHDVCEVSCVEYYKINKAEIIRMNVDITSMTTRNIQESIEKLCEHELISRAKVSYNLNGNVCVSEYYSEGYDYEHLEDLVPGLIR